jgi:hypothetical protein
VEDWTGNGWWLQISGFAFSHGPDTNSAGRLTLLTPEGARTIDLKEEILAVTNQFLLNPESGQDGYTMLNPKQIISDDSAKIELRDLVIKALKNSKAGIAPRVEGRICNKQRGKACLAVVHTN